MSRAQSTWLIPIGADFDHPAKVKFLLTLAESTFWKKHLYSLHATVHVQRTGSSASPPWGQSTCWGDWKFFCMRDLALSSAPLIYLSTVSCYHEGLSVFISYSRAIIPCTISFYLKPLALALGVLTLGSCVPLIYLYCLFVLFKNFSTSLLSGTIRCSEIILCIFYHFSRARVPFVEKWC